MTHKVILPRKPFRVIGATEMFAEEFVLLRLMGLLVSSQIFDRDEAFVTSSANLSFGAMPAGVMAKECQRAARVLQSRLPEGKLTLWRI